LIKIFKNGNGSDSRNETASKQVPKSALASHPRTNRRQNHPENLSPDPSEQVQETHESG